MKRILDNCVRRWSHDGWAMKHPDSTLPLDWSFCTTRRECRELRTSYTPDMYGKYKVVKVKVRLEVV